MKLLHYVCATLFFFLIPSYSYAQKGTKLNPNPCPSGYMIVYTNGILTTLQEAINDTNYLKQVAPSKIYNNQSVFYRTEYNQTFGVWDIVQTLQQRERSLAEIPSERLFTIIKSLYRNPINLPFILTFGIVGDLQNITTNIVAEFMLKVSPGNNTYEAESTRMQENAQRNANYGFKQLFISHSQGTLFQKDIDKALKKFPSYKGTYAFVMAGTAERIDKLPKYEHISGSYASTLSYGDNVIRTLNTLGSLGAGAPIFFHTPIDLKLLNHRFVDFYLAPDSATRKRIRQHIYSQINYLQTPVFRTTLFEVTLSWEGFADLDMVILEPDTRKANGDVIKGRMVRQGQLQGIYTEFDPRTVFKERGDEIATVFCPSTIERADDLNPVGIWTISVDTNGTVHAPPYTPETITIEIYSGTKKGPLVAKEKFNLDLKKYLNKGPIKKLTLQVTQDNTGILQINNLQRYD